MLTGVVLGTYMGATGDHRFGHVHAHINLLGFTLMSIFGIVYRVFPEMAENGLARIHFWLHFLGSLLFILMLALLFSETITEAGMAPLAPIAETAILVGVLLFLWNAFKNLK